MTDSRREKAIEWCIHQWSWPFRSETSKVGSTIRICVKCHRVEGRHP